jgi:hypothetical protein
VSQSRKEKNTRKAIIEENCMTRCHHVPIHFANLQPVPPGAMNKHVSALLGAVSLVPAVCAAIYVPVWLIAGTARLPVAVSACLAVLWLGFFVTTGYFIIKVLNAKGMGPMQQLLWFMALYSAAPIATPIYWWQHIRPLARS